LRFEADPASTILQFSSRRVELEITESHLRIFYVRTHGRVHPR
jgi:hypothetical protein